MECASGLVVCLTTTMSNEETLLEFPCRFPIKAMGRSEAAFESRVLEIVQRHAVLHPDEEVQLNPSKAGNFLAVTVVIEATSKDQLDRIYQDLTDCEQVLMAL